MIAQAWFSHYATEDSKHLWNLVFATGWIFEQTFSFQVMNIKAFSISDDSLQELFVFGIQSFQIKTMVNHGIKSIGHVNIGQDSEVVLIFYIIFAGFGFFRKYFDIGFFAFMFL